MLNDSLAKFMEAMGYDPNRISLVPIMTSNSLPEGTVLFSAENTTSSTPRRGYHAFDGDSDTFWATTGGTSAWIGYMFTENVKVSRVMVLTNGSGLSAIVRYSDDGTSWNNITSSTALSQNVENYIDVSHVNSHKYWSLSLSASATSTFNIKTLQFYGTKNA